MSKLMILFVAWRQADWRFKFGAVAMFILLVADIYVTAEYYGRTGVLWRPEMLATLVETAFFYIFITPLTMHILHIGLYKALRRSPTEDTVKSALAKMIAFIAIYYVLMYICITAFIRVAIATAP